MHRQTTTLQRFFAKVEITNSCWLWKAGTARLGYGSFWYGRHRPAHAVLYEILVCPIPKELECDHLCRVPACVNPDHIELVSHRENLLRGKGFIPQKAAQTHCVHGHIFSEENTYLRPNGTRFCRACGNLSTRRRRALRRESNPDTSAAPLRGVLCY